MPKSSWRTASTIELALRFPNGGYLGPADIALLETIRAKRSILSASKAMGLSYRKCWLMADTVNQTFETAAIATFPGRRGGGAQLTAFGERLVAIYRAIERQSRKASVRALDELTIALDPAFGSRSAGAARKDRPGGLRPSRRRSS